jgi:hapalindole H/12-epi-hapalindole U/12-epi-fischerindole U synthase
MPVTSRAVIASASRLLSACVTCSTLAQPIAITNPSFEANPAPPNAFAILIPQGWQLFDPAGIVDQGGDAVGVLRPEFGTNTFFPSGAPDGNNVALIYLEIDIGDGPVGLQQQLAATLQGDRRYTLTAEVGNIASGFGPPNNRFYNLDGFPGYAVELRAGNGLVAIDNNSLLGQIPEGEWRRSTITIDIPADHPLVGLPLRVRLINLNVAQTPENPGIEVDFDDVRLSSQPLVCPADFNADGSATVQDIFDFLTDWNSQATAGPTIIASADHNQTGGITVQDIFDFLAAWSAGC